jgi:hypothetical protein
MEQAGSRLTGLFGRFLLPEGVDQFHRGEEPYPLPVVLDTWTRGTVAKWVFPVGRKVGASCSVSSAAACARPCILSLHSMMVMAAAAGS